MANNASNESNKKNEPLLGLTHFVESIREGYYNPAEPFDKFAGRTKAQIAEQLQANGDRMMRGYEALLKELSKEE